jgi:hypothetical protein
MSFASRFADFRVNEGNSTVSSKRLSPYTCLLAVLSLALPLAASVGAEPRTFETPEAAAAALIDACRTSDAEALQALVDEDADKVFELSDPGTRDRLARFAAAADRRLVLADDVEELRVMIVGFNAYPFPVPIVKTDAGWVFDAEEGLEEVVDRTIGWNELIAISLLGDFVEAQEEYASEPRDGTDLRQFARRILSTEGKHDGLYWDADVEAGEEPSPFGPLEDPTHAKPERGAPYYGYHYRVLTRQGKDAPGGKYSYEINDNLVAGFAAIAWPASYGKTGIKTFLVNHYGIVYEKDLGEDTEKYASKQQAYDPGEGWEPVVELD